MKSKIFKRSLLALLILLSISPAFAQEERRVAKPAPPAPPARSARPLKANPPLFDDTSFQYNMKDVQIKMKDLHLKIAKIKMPNFKYQMDMKLKLVDKQLKHLNKKMRPKMDSIKLKKFNYRFSDSLDFAFDFNDSTIPPVAFGFKDFDANFSYKTDEHQQDDGGEKVKNYSKSYPVDANDVISLDNHFGRITVNTWTKNEVKVDVEIKVAASDDDKAQKLLDNVNIRDSKNSSGVSFKTDIDSDNNNGWSLFGGKHSNFRKIEVNYMVYMPAKNPLNVRNQYGSTILPDLEGKLNINTSYGSLQTKALSNPGNQITVQYGSANIGSLNGSDVDVAYGSLNLGECNKLNADISYSSAKIEKINTSGNLNLRFGGGLTINQIDKNVKKLAINSSYTSIKLGIGNEQNSNFDVTVSYGNFNYGGHDVNITSKSPADGERGYNPTKSYKGHLGKGGSDQTITINSSYGSISFN